MSRDEILKTAKPILFNTEMVKAILDGRKTVTRRAVKMKYGNTHIELRKNKYGSSVIEIQNDVEGETFGKNPDGTSYQRILAYRDVKPPFKVGNYLYVRETWFYEEHMHDVTAGKPDLPSGRYSFRYIYKAREPDYPVDVGVGANGWRPSIHMPKEAARIFLRVTSIRVEKLQDILKDPPGKNNQVVKEGCSYTCDFIATWINTIKKSDLDKYGWDANPWVWVIEFERLEVE